MKYLHNFFLTKAHMLRAFIITQFQGATKALDGPAYYSKDRFSRVCTCNCYTL